MDDVQDDGLEELGDDVGVLGECGGGWWCEVVGAEASLGDELEGEPLFFLFGLEVFVILEVGEGCSWSVWVDEGGVGCVVEVEGVVDAGVGCHRVEGAPVPVVATFVREGVVEAIVDTERPAAFLGVVHGREEEGLCVGDAVIGFELVEEFGRRGGAEVELAGGCDDERLAVFVGVLADVVEEDAAVDWWLCGDACLLKQCEWAFLL